MISPANRGRVSLAVTLSDGRRTGDVIVDADPHARVADLASAAAAYLGGHAAGPAIRVGRNLVAGETAIGFAGLRQGDTITVAVGDPSVQLAGPAVRTRDPEVRLRGGRLKVDVGEPVTRTPSAGTHIDGPRPSRSTSRATRHAIPADEGRQAFNRPPRLLPAAEAGATELPVPPESPRKAHLPIGMALIPLAFGLVMFLVLKSPQMLLFAAFTPVMAVTSYMTDRRSGRAGYREEYARFVDEVASMNDGLAARSAAEATRRRAAAPDIRTVLAAARQKHQRLWERRPSDPDFLELRLGTADLPSEHTVTQRDQGEQQLRDYARSVADQYRVVPDVPLTFSLPVVGGVGLHGDVRAVRAIATSLVVQISGLHSPGEVVIAAAMTESSARAWDWLKWLPHTADDVTPLDDRPLAVGRDASEHMLDQIQAIIGRRTRSGFDAGPRDDGPSIVLLLDEELGPRPSRVAELLADVARARVHVLWLGRRRKAIPGRCSLVVGCSAPGTVAINDATRGTSFPAVAAEPLDSHTAGAFARTLTPLRDETVTRRGAEVPRRTTLVEMLDDPGVDELSSRWSTWDGQLRGPIGGGAGGAVTVDLRRDGPHGLIVGTTGSGKSELLRTIVASLCTTCPPSRLSCLLIDYKGGAAFAPCAGFPHVVDVVSDLDEELAERALVSLDAEMRRRERILAEYRADNLLELERIAPQAAPPSLLIMVDEFARLREEIPDFVDGVTDIMQRGRTLGVHTLLAAQTLRNSSTNAIRANTNLRIALRVADESESAEVIGVKDAAWIPSGSSSKGRAFANTGHQELTELQVAYVSGNSGATAGGVTIRPFGFRKAVDEVVMRSGGVTRASGATDLVQLAQLASAAADALGIEPPPRPWLPPLDPCLQAEEVALDTVMRLGQIAVGRIDDPERQQQPSLVLDFERDGHAVVYGTGGSGKTTLLRSLAMAAATGAGPDAAHVYGIDAAGHGLSVLTELPHCGAVVGVDDEERVERLLATLVDEAERRARLFGPEGAASLRQHDQLGGAPLPRVFLLIDGFGQFTQRYDVGRANSAFDHVTQLLASGRGVGIHLVLTADRRGALNSTLAAHVGARLVLRMASPEDAVTFGIDPKVARHTALPPGRGFTDVGHVFQTALPAGVAGPDSQAEGIRAQAERLTARWPSTRAPAVRALPAAVSREELPASDGLDCLNLGMGGPALTALGVDLTDRHFLVAGNYRTGRSTALRTLALGLAEAHPEAQLHLLAPRKTPLQDLDIWTTAAVGMDAAVAAVADVEQAVAERGTDGTETPMVVVIDDAGELGDMAIYSRLEQLVRRGRDLGVRLVVGAETAAARNVTISWMRELRKDGQGLLLCPELPHDGDLLGASLPRRAPSPFTPGRGYLVAPGSAALVQVAR